MLHAANNEITDEAFRAQYRAEMGIDLPTMSTWKQYLDEIEKNRDKAAYASFFEDINWKQYLDGKMSREGTIRSVGDIDRETDKPRPEEPPIDQVTEPSATAVGAPVNAVSNVNEDENSLHSSKTMVRKETAAQQEAVVPAKEGDLVNIAEDEVKEGTNANTEGTTENADTEEQKAEEKQQPPPSGKNTIPDNENVIREKTSSSSSSGNANTVDDGMAGIAGRAPENYGEAGQTNIQDIAKSSKGTIHPVAVKRIAGERQLNIQPYFAAFAKDHSENIKQMTDSELYQTNVELCDQYIETMRVKKPRFVSGRNNLVREYIELSVLSKLSNSPAKNLNGSSRLGLLLDTSNMDINMQNLMDAISTAKNMAVEGGGDGNVTLPAGQAAQGVNGNTDLPVKSTKGQAHDKTKSGMNPQLSHALGKNVTDPGLFDRVKFDKNYQPIQNNLGDFFNLKYKNTDKNKSKRILL